LSDENFKFHNTVKRHYSGEVKNIYITLLQIYAVNGLSNFIRIAPVLYKILQKAFCSLFFWKHCNICFTGLVNKYDDIISKNLISSKMISKKYYNRNTARCM